jgi:HEAT repeat protein
LSHWVEELRVSWQGPGSAKATEAVRAIGTNALPYLVSALKGKDSRLKVRLAQLCGRQNLIKFPFRLADEKRDSAVKAFLILGPTASGAVPNLAATLSESDLTRLAAVALLAIGSNSIPVLTEACDHTNASVRRHAAFALSKLTTGTWLDLQGYTTVSGDIIAGLRANLSSPVAAVRRASAEVLALPWHSDAAKAAIPELVKALEDSDEAVREAVAAALKKIDSNAAAKAGVK